MRASSGRPTPKALNWTYGFNDVLGWLRFKYAECGRLQGIGGSVVV